MENEKLQVVLGQGVTKAELVVREVSEVNELEVKAPIRVDLSGTIGAPLEFLTKRLSEEDQINQKRCHVLVNRENLTIKLVICEDDQYKEGKVLGTLQKHPKFKEFGINDNAYAWDPNELGQFFKMNRAFFPDKSENMKLVTDLKNFEAKVNTTIEKQKADNGSFADNYSGVVTSNLPGAFKLRIPLFKGRPAEDLEVEFYASINGRSVKLYLMSPGACQALEDLRDKVIDEQLDAIREIAPEIAIIEQ